MATSNRPFWKFEVSEQKEVGRATERGRRRARAKFGAILGALVFVLLVQGQAAQAATITVSTTVDELNGDGDCSLREAIQAANTDSAVDACPAGSGADTITVPAGTYTLSIAGAGEDANATGDLDITADLTINGAGAATTIIDGADLDRIFHIGLTGFGSDAATAEIAGLTIQNGLASEGGGILNWGDLTLEGAAVSDNTAIGGICCGGGGILNARALTVTNSTVSGNATNSRGGGISNEGWFTTLTNSTVSGNTAASEAGGGGLYTQDGRPLTLTNSTVSNNTSQGPGGGIVAVGSTLTLTNSTVSNNTSRQGGGIFIANGTTDSPATLTNSTVSSNMAIIEDGGGDGAGIWLAGGVLNLTNSTVSNNTANDHGGGMFIEAGTVTVANSTVSGNTAINSGGGIFNAGETTLINTLVANSGGDCVFLVTSAGHNLSSDGTCGFTASGDLQNTDPMLGPLADNGGPTQTHALLAGSPAIDAGSSDCPPPATDQRGVARPQGAACDIGAFELLVLDATPPTITITTDPSDTVAASGWYNIASSGSDGVLVNISASDASGVTNITCTSDAAVVLNTSASAGSFVLLDGIKSISCTASDGVGNTGAGPGSTSMPIIFQIDQTAPTVLCQSPPPIFILNQFSASVSATVSDVTSGPLAASISTAADTTSVGAGKTVQLTGSDVAGNSKTESCLYGVRYNFSGFFSPIDNPGPGPTFVFNVGKAGSAFPVKFSLSGNQGLNIFDTGFPVSQQIACDASATLDVIEQTATAGSSSLSYDAVTDQYVYVWKTDKAWANTCRQLIVQLNDGSAHVAYFKFTK